MRNLSYAKRNSLKFTQILEYNNCPYPGEEMHIHSHQGIRGSDFGSSSNLSSRSPWRQQLSRWSIDLHMKHVHSAFCQRIFEEVRGSEMVLLLLPNLQHRCTEAPYWPDRDEKALYLNSCTSQMKGQSSQLKSNTFQNGFLVNNIVYESQFVKWRQNVGSANFLRFICGKQRLSQEYQVTKSSPRSTGVLNKHNKYLRKQILEIFSPFVGGSLVSLILQI